MWKRLKKSPPLCGDGVCEDAPVQICTETDNGNDIFNVGITSDQDHQGPDSLSDYCISDSRIQEYYCGQTQPGIGTTMTECPTTGGCLNGECVGEIRCGQGINYTMSLNEQIEFDGQTFRLNTVDQSLVVIGGSFIVMDGDSCPNGIRMSQWEIKECGDYLLTYYF